MPAAARGSGGVPYYGCVITPLPAEDDSDGASDQDTLVSGPRRSLVTPERAFYRVLRESKLYSMDFGSTTDGAAPVDQPKNVVLIQEIAKTGNRSGLPQDRNGGYIVRVALHVSRTVV